jgi:hypothetical protein
VVRFGCSTYRTQLASFADAAHHCTQPVTNVADSLKNMRVVNMRVVNLRVVNLRVVDMRVVDMRVVDGVYLAAGLPVHRDEAVLARHRAEKGERGRHRPGEWYRHGHRLGARG